MNFAPNSGWWFATFPASVLPELAAHRLAPGWEALLVPSEGSCWLRGPARGDALPPAILRAGPSAVFLAETSLGPLVPAGGRVPRRLPPAGNWQALSRVLVPSLPPVSLPPVSNERLPLRWKRASAPHPVKAVLTRLGPLSAALGRVPALWCDGLTFAAASDGAVLVLGLTHSFLPGLPLASAHGLAWPLGMCFDPEGIGPLVASALALRPGDVALFRSANSPPEVIPQECLLPLTRAAVRATRKESPAHG